MSTIFVTASGTGVGKTLVTAALARQLRARGDSVDVLKPVISGFDPADVETSDTGILIDALGEEISPDSIDRVSPWRFPAPLSPDMAAAREGRRIDFDALVEFCRIRSEGRDRLLIEGVGGAMVPLTDSLTVRDWIAAADAPALLVVGSYLGTVSHTLTAFEALRARKVAIVGIVVSESPDSPMPVSETAMVIARFAGDVPIATVPRQQGAKPWRTVPDLLDPLAL